MRGETMKNPNPPCVWNWAWEQILKDPLNHITFNSLLLSLPLPTNNLHLPKFILLKKLQSHNSFLETDLYLLEQIHEIDTQLGLQPSDAIKRAYCAIAVESTVKHLTKPDDEDTEREFMFFECVKRVWRNRIGRMKLELGDGGLGSEELWDWMDQLEAAVWDDAVLYTVLDKSKAINAVDAVGTYFKDEMERIGTSFVESMRDRVGDDDVMKEMAGLISNNAVDGVSENVVQPRNRAVGGSKRSRGAEIMARRKELAGPSKRTCKSPLSVEANNARKALEASSKELRKEEVRSSLRKGKGKEHDSVIVLDDDDDVVVQEPQLRVPEVASKEQNGPVQTSRVGLANNRGQIHISSPRKKIRSLSKEEIESLKNRRPTKRWTPEEEDTLRTGVREHGHGSWTLILSTYKDVFVDRTDMDLKDKWRNMTGYVKQSRGTLAS